MRLIIVLALFYSVSFHAELLNRRPPWWLSGKTHAASQLALRLVAEPLHPSAPCRRARSPGHTVIRIRILPQWVSYRDMFNAHKIAKQPMLIHSNQSRDYCLGLSVTDQLHTVAILQFCHFAALICNIYSTAPTLSSHITSEKKIVAIS